MGMDRERQPADRLFLSFARTFRLEEAHAKAQEDSDLARIYDLEAIFAEVDEMRTLPARRFAERYRMVAPTVDPTVRSYLLLFYLQYQQSQLGLADLEVIEAEVAAAPGDAQLDGILLACLRGFLKVRAGQVSAAVALLSELNCHVDSFQTSLYGRYVQALMLRNLGFACQRAGYFEAAHRHLGAGLAVARAHKFLLVLSCNSYLGSLLWASGQHREALAIHKDETLRELARSTGSHNQLLHSLVSASKCAIDLKATSAAAAELEEARQLLAATPGAWPEINAYVMLYTGELAVQQEQFDQGLELISQALERFEALDPPHYPGVLDAKIALTHFAFYERNYRAAFALLQKLLGEAESHGCLEARSRLLVLEAYLYVTENPPLKSAYEDLVSRVHLINNPALLFRALGNLYTYALEHLEETEQLFLLERVRNLKEMLDGSCYDDLYRRYITERYEYAIENRLARYVQEDWVTWEDPE